MWGNALSGKAVRKRGFQPSGAGMVQIIAFVKERLAKPLEYKYKIKINI